MVRAAVSQGLCFTTEDRRDSPRGIAAIKGIKATTDYTDGTDKDGDGQSHLSSDLSAVALAKVGACRGISA